ncbi:PLD nuclease N-terminal domain-containing protein [uncultured Sphaerochaeta sp.]|uniref:PLD nuclease N-terminal domain-containing protein n=1 Tax=uncultured Sphaerochaeta sp. TaxID=886478 RepID=UPI002A0A900B|nr:PLD nuclease N-terminal domain-containing protein [uncultured Sphaerochaeta sp.]
MNTETIILILPLLLLELILKIVCLRDWLHREEFNALPKTAWLLVFLFINAFGPIVYLIYGRKTNGNR